MKPDNLDDLTDAELSQAFAVECAGWKRGTSIDGVPALWPPDSEPPCGRRQGKWPHGVSCEDFATSANAVLPFLEKIGHRVEWGRSEGCQYGLYIWTFPVPAAPFRAIQPTLARAACIALIRAKRAEKGAA